jgi:hypothetical protein
MAERSAKVPTQPERVRVFLKGGLVAEGNAHKHVGGYQTRISDILNRDHNSFIALTDVTYQGPHAPPTRTDTFLVHVDDIVGVDATPGGRETPPPPAA